MTRNVDVAFLNSGNQGLGLAPGSSSVDLTRSSLADAITGSTLSAGIGLQSLRQPHLVAEGNSVERLDELFELRAAACPDTVAVICGDRQLTYRELLERARHLAGRLLALGVRPGDLVGLCVHRSPEMIIGAYGILMAGGAYVPLDPSYPSDRLAYMLEDAQASVLVTQHDLAERLSPGTARLVYVEDEVGLTEDQAGAAEKATAAELADPWLPRFDPDQLAYVIYTSGSTGRPKGVMITHRCAVNTIVDINARFQMGAGDRVLALSSLCFDLSVYDIFGLLAIGGTVVIPEPERHLEPAYWADLIEQHGITVWNSVPAFMEILTTHAAGQSTDRYGSLRRVMLSGDWIPVSLPDRIRELSPQAEVISLGGATEVSIWSIYYPIGKVDPTWKSIPYGRALANQTVYVLDDNLQRCDVGVTGEIYIGGDGLAIGYRNRPDLNAEKFIADPHSLRADGRLYRTGDLGRYLSDGDIEFLGRMDHQVKIHGFRIELGEIESALVRHPSVAEGVVVARQGATGGGKFLAAYLVLKPQEAVSDAELMAFLRQGLPDYMVPARFVRLDRMPLNVNGKVDRGALPDITRPAADVAAADSTVSGFVAPRDEIEVRLTVIWQQELGVEQVGIRDKFLDLGGDSLMAVSVFAHIEKEFRRSLPPAALLERPTIEALAELLRDPEQGRQTASLVALQPSGTLPPLICLPGISGNLWEFRRLSRRLGADVPLYGLQPVGLDGEQTPHATIAEMAEHYLSEVRAMQPSGPYYLAGYSIGGVIAYEMAQQLRAAGENVALLALVDAPAGGFSRPMRMVAALANGFGDLLSKIKARLSRGDANAAASAGLDFAAIELLEPAGWSRVSDIHRQALDDYVLRPYSGRVTVFRASIRPAWPKRLVDNINLRWIRLAKDGGEVHLIPSNHDQMFRDGSIEVLAEKLKTCLVRAAG